MDGDPVEGEPSQPDEPISLAEFFTEICPQYMALGMTYDEFWNSNTKVHKAYREAWKMKCSHRNYEMWLNGMYVYYALLCVAPVMRASFSKGKVEPGDYLDQPFPLTNKEAQERKEAKNRENFKRFLDRMQTESKQELQRRAESRQEVNTDARDQQS